jgi:hypothetical protein
MALKDVLEDKKKKRTITIVGTIAIILVTAGVFSYEASSIEVKEPPKEEETTGETTTTTTVTTGNETENHWEYEGTLRATQSKDYSFTVEEGAKKIVIKLDCVNDDADFDLYVYDANGDKAGSSATGAKDEEVTITSGFIPGEWEATVKRFGIPIRPIDAEYKLVIDVYYE